MEPSDLKSLVESILFVSSKPLSVKELSRVVEKEASAVQSALDSLAQDRKNCGIILLENNDQYQLATAPANSEVVKNFLNTELREKLTEATVEVLGIIAYRQPISKAEIEAIRGVNSQYSVRHLLMRGLIEKIPNPHDQRSVLYQTTTEFLMHMGLQSIKELPEFDKLVAQIKLPETPALSDMAESSPEQTEIVTSEEKVVEEEPKTERFELSAQDTSLQPQDQNDNILASTSENKEEDNAI